MKNAVSHMNRQGQGLIKHIPKDYTESKNSKEGLLDST